MGANLYGCDISAAQEIIPLRRITRLPGAPPFVRGLINMRGTIVTVLDLGMRLDPSRAPITDGSILLVRHRERLVGLIVEEVADVRALDVEPREEGIVRGVATVGDAGAESDEGVEAVEGAEGKDGMAADLSDGERQAVVLLDLEFLFKQVLLS